MAITICGGVTDRKKWFLLPKAVSCSTRPNAPFCGKRYAGRTAYFLR